MPNSKVIWSSPEINRNRKVKNAQQLSDSSFQSLKFQVVFFWIILFEIYFNLVQKIFSIKKESLDNYRIICKTLLSVNLIFLLCYAYQIVLAKFRIFFINNDNSLLCMVKSILFTLVPNLKSVYEKLTKTKLYHYLYNKSVADQEKAKARIIEERRKILTKSYFPSMMTQYGNHNDQYVHRPVEHLALARLNRLDPIAMQTPPNKEFCRPLQQSTPFNDAKTTSINFGADITPIQSPNGLGDGHRPSFGFPIVTGGRLGSPPTTASDSWCRTGARYSPSGVLAIKGHTSVLTEVPVTEVWKRLGIDCRLLDDWTFSLRQWLHGTIVARVVAEIDSLNCRFREFGITDVVIGESHVQTLRHLSSQPATPFPTLETLINFLDCSKDQAYVVNRLRELAQGCSLGKFQWDGGSSSVRHAWKEHLPNDTVLVLHLLCTYIDVKYSLQSGLHGARTFIQQFVTDNALTRDLSTESKDAFLLYQTAVQPPHFKVIFDQAVYEMPPGRKNLFQCLLVFFYKIYCNEGNFKWLNLGRSGMNINNIFDK